MWFVNPFEPTFCSSLVAIWAPKHQISCHLGDFLLVETRKHLAFICFLSSAPFFGHHWATWGFPTLVFGSCCAHLDLLFRPNRVNVAIHSILEFLRSFSWSAWRLPDVLCVRRLADSLTFHRNLQHLGGCSAPTYWVCIANHNIRNYLYEDSLVFYYNWLHLGGCSTPKYWFAMVDTNIWERLVRRVIDVLSQFSAYGSLTRAKMHIFLCRLQYLGVTCKPNCWFPILSINTCGAATHQSIDLLL